MVYYEKLNRNNFSFWGELVKESFSYNKYKKKADDFYLNLNFFKKMFYKNNILLIKLGNSYVGYIWYELLNGDTVNIEDIYIKNNFIKLINLSKIDCFYDKIIIFQGFEDEITKQIMSNNYLTKFRITKLMKINTLDKKPIVKKQNLSIRCYIRNRDEQTRCNIQNKVFNDNHRVPLQVKDIKFEQAQSYFIDELSMFLVYKNIVVGYGQVVFNKNMYMVVNFGILEEHRGKGFGEFFLISILDKTFNTGIENIYIRVDPNNIRAFDLYKKIGFIYLGDYITWVKS